MQTGFPANGKKLVNLLPTSQNIFIFPCYTFALIADLWLWRFQVKFSNPSQEPCSGAAPLSAASMLPQKSSRWVFYCQSQDDPVLPSLPWHLGIEFTPAIWMLPLKPCTEATGHSAKKVQRSNQTQGGYFNCSNFARNLKPTAVSYKQVPKVSQQHRKNKYLYLSLPLQICAGTTKCRILPPSPSLSLFFFFT